MMPAAKSNPTPRRRSSAARATWRRWGATCLSLALALLATQAGCRAGPAARADTPGRLTVRVEPAQGIGIVLDGARVADHSPYENAALAPGNHVLEVRGMGRHTVALPFTLASGAALDIPVVLRVRAPTPFVDAPEAAPATSSPAPGGAGDGGVPRVRPSLGNRAHAPLPPGATPLRMAVAPTPPATISADGTEMAGTDVRLGYGQGLLQVGDMRLAYRVYPGRALELTVPHEDVPWFLGEQQVKAKSLVRVSASPVVLRRGTGPTQQQVWLRRLE